MSALRVVVVGGRGRFGSRACEWIEAAEEMELAGVVEADDSLEDALRASGARVGLDVTRAGLGLEHGLAMLSCGVRPVIGTSGVDASATERLDHAAREAGLGGLVVPNFSVGMWLLQRAAELAARHLPRFEVLEMHHERKLDAPSGTAVDTAERLAAASGRDPGDIPIHSVRLPGATANQEVVFGSAGEWLRLRHETYDYECFRAGMLAALRHAATAEGVGRGVGVALEAG